MIKNSAGKIFYGMHFYPGLAQYDGPDKKPYKIFLNEDVLRKMDPTFAGRPIFVDHVDGVEPNIDELRKDAHGWVIESFFNEADGKHWTKFLSVSEVAERAIRNGYRLSNAYLPKLNGKAGVWNGIPYDDEVVDGEYEHLAIVKNPRYDESVIMTPEEFKKYNEDLKRDLDRIANSKDVKEKEMPVKFKFWERKAVENSVDIEKLSVTLPKSNKEYTLLQIINSMDEVEEKKKENAADMGSMVKLHDGTMCNVGELLERCKNMHEELEGLKKNAEVSEIDETTLALEQNPVEVAGDLHNEDEPKEEPKAEEKDKMKNKKTNAIPVSAKKGEHFNALKNAHLNVPQAEVRFDSSAAKVARGKLRYGSN